MRERFIIIVILIFLILILLILIILIFLITKVSDDFMLLLSKTFGWILFIFRFFFPHLFPSDVKKKKTKENENHPTIVIVSIIRIF